MGKRNKLSKWNRMILVMRCFLYMVCNNENLLY